MRARTAAVAAVAATAGGAGAAVALAADQTVDFVCCQYSPKTVTIGVGEQVTFRPGSGQDFEGANSSSHPLDFVDPSIPDQTTGSQPVARRFDRAGTYAYFCPVHGTADGGMNGRVVVADATSTSTTQTSTATTGTTTTATTTTTTTPATTTPAPTSPTATTTPPVDPTLTSVRATASRTISLSTLLRRGLAVRVTANGAGSFTVHLRRFGQDLSGMVRGRVASGGSRQVRVKLNAKGRRVVRRQASTIVSVRVAARPASGGGRGASFSRDVRVRR